MFSIPVGDIFANSEVPESRLGGLTSYCGKIAREAAEAELQAQDKLGSSSPGLRFRSSFSGVLTQAQRKEYPPPASVLPAQQPTTQQNPEPNNSSDSNIVKSTAEEPVETNVINLSQQKQPEPVVVRCSVIQRVPSSATSSSSSSLSSNSNSSSPSPQPPSQPHKKQLTSRSFYHCFPRPPVLEPEQEHPIDYHIPKKRDQLNHQSEHIGDEEEEDKRIKKFEKLEEREKRVREAKRAYNIRSIISQIRNCPPSQSSKVMRHLTGIMQAAAGHGRSNNSSGNQNAGSNGSTQNSGTTGGSINFTSGSGQGCVGGGLGGAAGGGNGRDGRSNYGPNSPPTGSLPPFYESLKGGNQNGMNAYNAQNNGFGNYMIGTQMDCDGNVTDLTNLGYPGSPSDQNANKQYSLLQNAYMQSGLVLKDEVDLDYDGKMDALSLTNSLMQNFDSYNDNNLMDISGAVEDPSQFSGTITLAAFNNDTLLDSLSDADALNQFLQRLPSDDDNLELSSTPSLTPDQMDPHGSNGNCLQFQDQLIIGRNNYSDTDSKSFFKSSPSSTSSYENPPPNYREHNNNNTNANNNGSLHNSLLQQQHHHNQHPHLATLNGFDLDSHSNLSLPSPHFDHQLNSPTSLSQLEPNNNNSTTPSPTTIASTIQNVSVSKLQKQRRTSTVKLASILANNVQEQPNIGDVKVQVLQQRVSESNLEFFKEIRNFYDFFTKI